MSFKFLKILYSIQADLTKQQPIQHCVNTVISPNFLFWNFCGKVQFTHSFGRFNRNYAGTVPFHKISTAGNWVKLRCFTQCEELLKSSYNITSFAFNTTILF